MTLHENEWWNSNTDKNILPLYYALCIARKYFRLFVIFKVYPFQHIWLRSPPSVLLRCKVCVDRTQHLQRFEGKSDFPRNEFVYVMIFFWDVLEMNHFLAYCVTMNTWYFHHFTKIFHDFNSYKTCISKRLMNLSIKYQNVNQNIILKRFCNYMSRQFIPKGKLTPWKKIR